MAENNQNEPIRWGRWIGWIAVLLILVLLTAHAIWSSIASGRLQALVAQARAAGQPVLVADFAVTNVDVSDNAGPDIVAAAQMIDPSGPEWKKYDDLRESLGIPLRQNERDAIESVVPVLAPAIKRLDAANGKTRVDWDFALKSPALDQLMDPNLNKIRGLANSLQMRSLLDADQGHHRAALDRIEPMLLVSRLPDRHPSLVGHLVAIGCAAIAADTVIDIAPDLKIGAGPDDATPEQIRGVIDSLLDDRSISDGLLLAFYGERMMQLDFMQGMTAGAPPGAGRIATGMPSQPVARYFMRPIINQNAAIMFRQMSNSLPAVSEKTWPDARAKLPVLPRTGSLLNRYAELLMPSMDRAVETHFRVLVERRLAAVVLAVRWYSVEHAGQLPAKLEDLVPEYLPAIPMDPLAAGAHPLRYIA